jgi:hypothetical protein
MNRKPIPTSDQIRKAIELAENGKGRQLAQLVKSFSVDDLAAGFSAAGSGGWFYPHTLLFALSHAAGRRQGRREIANMMRDIRKEYRAKQKEAA